MLINIPSGKDIYIKHSRDDCPTESSFQMHAHSHYEILVFISGDISYLVEGNIYRPEPWDILIFNIAETHKVNVCSDKAYERIVIQLDKELFSEILPHNTVFSPFFDRELGKNNILHPKDFSDELWKNELLRLSDGHAENRFESLAHILSLLSEIKTAFEHKDKNQPEESLASRIVRYTNEHITERLTADSIAKQFFISRSALYALFRESTGTGIHDYINVKRLILAQELILSGEKPTDVYEKCGFGDYSTFFRAYKSRFSLSPSESGSALNNRH